MLFHCYHVCILIFVLEPKKMPGSNNFKLKRPKCLDNSEIDNSFPFNHFIDLLDHFGVTRLANITGYDYIDFPVWSAIRPESMIWQCSAGKGRSNYSAIISCGMETLETAYTELYLKSAIDIPIYSAYRTSYRRIDDRLVHLESTKLLGEAFQKNSSWKNHLIIGSELKSNQDILLPLHWGYLSEYTANYGFVTNGLGGGCSHQSAQRQAIFELLERHYLSLSFANKKFKFDTVKSIDLNSLPDYLSRYVSDIRDKGLQLIILDFVSSRIPLSWVIIYDCHPITPNITINFGSKCADSLVSAIEGALLEAIQQRCSQIQGNREDVSPTPLSYSTQRATFVFNQFSQIKKSKFESKSIKADDLSILLDEIPGPVYEISYNSKTSLLQFCKLIAPLCLFNQSLF